MIEDDCLPLLLISTSDSNCVNKFVADLVEEDRPIETSDNRVWRIQNKYYRADVRVQVWPDGAPPPMGAARLEAHLIYLQATEGEQDAERRAAEAAALGGRAHVRLAVLEGPETEALAAWASRRRYELVPLTPDADAEDEGDDARGTGRARAALHAHTWRGLERVDGGGRPPDSPSASDDEADEDEAWGEWAAWGVVGAAREARGALGAEPDAARRQRAEALLQAFLATLRPRAP